ncbi:MAG: EamA family transporter RarD, partial [Myxococcales bacterium]|nr:EamA family transporter RarD [Myxococcales bacterium]
ERIVEASLGYFITPLANVGWAVLGDRERMRSGQWLSFAFAAIGVAILTLAAGHLPWISLVLAATFSTYGFVRRRIRVPALVGQTMEMVVLAPVAMILISRGEGTNGEPLALLWLAGPLTLLPLILFAGAARRLPYSRLGLFQYIAPTLQLLLAVFLYGEPFGEARLMAFALIWMGIAIYCVDYLRFEKRAQAEARA